MRFTSYFTIVVQKFLSFGPFSELRQSGIFHFINFAHPIFLKVTEINNIPCFVNNICPSPHEPMSKGYKINNFQWDIPPSVHYDRTHLRQVSLFYILQLHDTEPFSKRLACSIPLRLVKKFRSFTLQSREFQVLTTMKNIKYMFWFFIMKSYTIFSDLNIFAIALVSHIVLATPEAFILSWDKLFYSVLTAVRVLCCQQL